MQSFEIETSDDDIIARSEISDTNNKQTHVQKGKKQYMYILSDKTLINANAN